jgi:hypothetical protein
VNTNQGIEDNAYDEYVKNWQELERTSRQESKRMRQKNEETRAKLIDYHSSVSTRRRHSLLQDKIQTFSPAQSQTCSFD